MHSFLVLPLFFEITYLEKTKIIFIKGLVQGVGFRPFIYRTAKEFGLKGTVENRNDGVRIMVTGSISMISGFKDHIRLNAPAASIIETIDSKPLDFIFFPDFKIIKSTNVSDEITLVSPDIAVCHECLEDMKTQEHRLDYPFINCTNCGPRFTIVKQLPYDRMSTTMDVFTMCDKCREEYENVLDRRFHAQPIACRTCGPRYKLFEKDTETAGLISILSRLRILLDKGGVVAVKGIGGFFLSCDANNQRAVEKIRKLKNREGKPFAVMFSDEQTLQEYAFLNQKELELISSWQRPIVLLRKKKDLAIGVTMGFPTIGAMLPYMPFHSLLFEKIKQRVLVLTSGNLSEEPIVIDNNSALEEFLPGCDAVLTYNRDIYNRVDDSILNVINNKMRIIRRSRGYVPAPILLKQNVEGIVAAGAELVNCFCLGKGNKGFFSQHIGDLKNLETYQFYQESFNRYKNLFRIEPTMFVVDFHPDYLSTRFADQSGLPLIRVQHHHAHIASCMAEHGLDEKLIGVAFDGVGLGDDGNIWGGEFMLCDLKGYERVSHFDYQAMPGGDMATLNPWRMAISYLYSLYGDSFLKLDLPFIQKIKRNELKIVVQMLKNNINCPKTSSTGRLFDAIAALTGLCLYSDFHAEAPMRLESVISDKPDDSFYEFEIGKTISVNPMIRQIVLDLQQCVPVAEISQKFHNTMVEVIQKLIKSISETSGLKKVVLSGGTFQNKYLLEKVENKLKMEGFNVFVNEKTPCNDGGIALGQLVIAAKKRESGLPG